MARLDRSDVNDFYDKNKKNWLNAERRIQIENYRNHVYSIKQLKYEYNKIQGNTEDKRRIVEEDPIKAAKMFYHFGDNSIGEMIVDRYSSDAGKVELALRVKDVLHLRVLENKSLRNILGMREVPQLYEHDDDDWSRENSSLLL